MEGVALAEFQRVGPLHPMLGRVERIWNADQGASRFLPAKQALGFTANAPGEEKQLAFEHDSFRDPVIISGSSRLMRKKARGFPVLFFPIKGHAIRRRFRAILNGDG